MKLYRGQDLLVTQGNDIEYFKLVDLTDTVKIYKTTATSSEFLFDHTGIKLEYTKQKNIVNVYIRIAVKDKTVYPIWSKFDIPKFLPKPQNTEAFGRFIFDRWTTSSGFKVDSNGSFHIYRSSPNLNNNDDASQLRANVLYGSSTYICK